MPEPMILTRYRVKVHASNRSSDYGIPVEVYADTKREAVDRAIAVAWAGERRDARVTVLDVKQEVHIAALASTDATADDEGSAACSDCGMPGQCAGCYLMASRGIPTPPRAPTAADEKGASR